MPDGLGFGVDVGGSGVKGAPVDLTTGELAADRIRIDTPRPARPDAVADVVAEVVDRHGWTGPIGITMPSVLRAGVAHTAANLDAPEWIGTDVATLFAARLATPVTVLNDADAAGIGELHHGQEHPAWRRGVVVVLTFGTGIGSAVFVHGNLLPNTEFGHLELDGHVAEHGASAAVREHQDLSWSEWARRVSRYLRHLESLVWPDLFVLGGGVSRKGDRWIPQLECRTPTVAATLRNGAGIVGAALATAAHTAC